MSFGFNGSPGNVGSDVPTNYVLNGVALGAGVPSLNIDNVTVNDGTAGNKAVFTVALSQAATKTVTVQLRDGRRHRARRHRLHRRVGHSDVQPGHGQPDDLGADPARHDGQGQPDVPGQSLERR